MQFWKSQAAPRETFRLETAGWKSKRDDRRDTQGEKLTENNPSCYGVNVKNPPLACDYFRAHKECRAPQRLVKRRMWKLIKTQTTIARVHLVGKNVYVCIRALSALVKIRVCRTRKAALRCCCERTVLQWILQWYNVPKIPLTSGRVSARVAARNLLLTSHFNKSEQGDRNFQRIAGACFLGDCIPTRGKAGSTWKLQLRKLLIATSAGTYTQIHRHTPACTHTYTATLAQGVSLGIAPYVRLINFLDRNNFFTRVLESRTIFSH